MALFAFWNGIGLGWVGLNFWVSIYMARSLACGNCMGGWVEFGLVIALICCEGFESSLALSLYCVLNERGNRTKLYCYCVAKL